MKLRILDTIQNECVNDVQCLAYCYGPLVIDSNHPLVNAESDLSINMDIEAHIDLVAFLTNLVFLALLASAHEPKEARLHRTTFNLLYDRMSVNS